MRNLNKIIDINNYPDEANKTSKLRHRPIVIGVEGLADTFFALRLPYESPGAHQLNRYIFETIYFAAHETSCHLASLYGTYESYGGTSASHGLLQYDLWDTTPEFDAWDWPLLKRHCALWIAQFAFGCGDAHGDNSTNTRRHSIIRVYHEQHVRPSRPIRRFSSYQQISACRIGTSWSMDRTYPAFHRGG